MFQKRLQQHLRKSPRYPNVSDQSLLVSKVQLYRINFVYVCVDVPVFSILCQIIQEFISGLESHFEDPERFRNCLLPCVPRSAGEGDTR